MNQNVVVCWLHPMHALKTNTGKNDIQIISSLNVLNRSCMETRAKSFKKLINDVADVAVLDFALFLFKKSPQSLLTKSCWGKSTYRYNHVHIVGECAMHHRNIGSDKPNWQIIVVPEIPCRSGDHRLTTHFEDSPYCWSLLVVYKHEPREEYTLFPALQDVPKASTQDQRCSSPFGSRSIQSRCPCNILHH